ncbi:hypothetical protein PATY110618_10270 [Paenibacillus typhae]|uniref:Uncharacterized protein n=1 Tax=Paenibacillus typhae TaxID=1174501 RepID=A0A1G8MBI8_9BACL|nr:hypothetical protein SAMN05216192_10758 [Paenibacillus typhae]
MRLTLPGMNGTTRLPGLSATVRQAEHAQLNIFGEFSESFR